MDKKTKNCTLQKYIAKKNDRVGVLAILHCALITYMMVYVCVIIIDFRRHTYLFFTFSNVILHFLLILHNFLGKHITKFKLLTIKLNKYQLYIPKL